ncbi:hypothetical protein A0H81_05849 [Grifola frondosa]|uniref:EF-hand domain-containing protein n=1 Tax=Grifola frondosa TaxID=5627 RepID=A0A1C7MB28_GRIFR|nr:hypothetical protein A0H81_05849 [Grifola frondosa]
MEPEDQDPGFALLPHHIRQRIDRAFDTAIAQADASAEPARKRRKLDHDRPDSTPLEPGGFIVDEPQPGGFLVDNSEAGGILHTAATSPGGSVTEEDTSEAHIPLSLIPTALQLLDLQPDDEDVLSVFRNAASGWGEGNQFAGDREYEREETVTRKDWRAESSDSGEEYIESGGEESDFEDNAEDSDDEYQEGGFMRTTSKTKDKISTPSPRKRTTRRASKVSEDSDQFDHPRSITARQKEECRRAFSLFFPHVSDEDLDKQRIMIKDITRVAKLLKEKITTEQTIEMLEAFSSSPDKSVNLADFERMMVAAKMA